MLLFPCLHLFSDLSFHFFFLFCFKFYMPSEAFLFSIQITNQYSFTLSVDVVRQDQHHFQFKDLPFTSTAIHSDGE